MKMNVNYKIEPADTKKKFEGLRTLWCEVFNDEPIFVDGMYEFFGANPKEGIYTSEAIKGYVYVDDSERVVSALTCFRCGDFENVPAYTSYAICTDPEFRGLGLAGDIVEQVRDIVVKSGGISIISPAEPSLENFYGAHGYETFFFADAHQSAGDNDEDFLFGEEDSEYEKIDPGINLTKLSAHEYNTYREEFLSDRPHVIMSECMMNLVYDESRRSDGSSGLYLVNNGDAICALGEIAEGSLDIVELLCNPKLLELSPEIPDEIARGIAGYYGKDAVSYHMPGSEICQSMIAGTENLPKGNSREAYYGFTID